MTHAVDDMLGVPRKRVVADRDVPGLTRSVIPVLAGAGIQAINIAPNAQPAPANVPPAFIWRDSPSSQRKANQFNGSRLFGVDTPSGKEMLTLFWDGWNYGVPGQPQGGCDMVCFQTFPGCDVAVYFNWLGEDSGPNVADAAAVLKLYEQAREQFPGAEVVSGGLDVIVEALLQPAARGALPVLTGEIGDTWAYGISSDPKKTRDLRLLMRHRSNYTAKAEDYATSDPSSLDSAHRTPSQEPVAPQYSKYPGVQLDECIAKSETATVHYHAATKSLRLVGGCLTWDGSQRGMPSSVHWPDNVVITPCNGSQSQRWNLSLGTGRSVVPERTEPFCGSSCCLNVAQFGTDVGHLVWVTPGCDNATTPATSNGVWAWKGGDPASGLLQGAQSSLCLGAASPPAPPAPTIPLPWWQNFSRLLLKGFEHTWGGLAQPDQQPSGYSNSNFHMSRSNGTSWIQSLEQTWVDQRTWAVDMAIDSIGDVMLRNEIDSERSALERLEREHPSTSGLSPVPVGSEVKVGQFTLTVDENGAIAELKDSLGRTWGGRAGASLLWLRYSLGTNAQMQTYRETYCAGNIRAGDVHCDEATYGKPGLPRNISVLANATVQGIWRGGDILLLEVGWARELHVEAGAPASTWVKISASGTTKLDVEVLLVNKTSTRQMESMFLTIAPDTPSSMRQHGDSSFPRCDWFMDKLGEYVDATDIMRGGSGGVSSIGSGVLCSRPCNSSAAGSSGQQPEREHMFVRSLDVAVVHWGSSGRAPGHGMLPAGAGLDGQPWTQSYADISTGVHFVLFDNVWNTNYIYWWRESLHSFFTHSID